MPTSAGGEDNHSIRFGSVNRLTGDPLASAASSGMPLR